MKVFDSTVLIAHLRGVQAATALLRNAVEEDQAACSVLSRVEIEGGMRSGERVAVSRLFAAQLLTLNVKHFPMVTGLGAAFH